MNDKQLTAELTQLGLTRGQAEMVVSIIIKERDNAYFNGCKVGFKDGYQQAKEDRERELLAEFK